MTKRRKYLIGIFYFWPLVYMGLFMALSLSFSVASPSIGTEQIHSPVAIIILNMFTYLCILGTFLFSVILLVRNKKVGLMKKILVIFLLILGNLFMLPLFWYLFILHDE